MAKSPIEFLRDYVTNGVPSSGAYNPPKRDLREYLLWLEGQIGGGGGGGGADYSDDIAALDSRMTTVEREVAERTASASHRPGDAPTLFSGEVAGSADQQAAQTLGTVVVTASGATLSLPGGAQLWTRQDTDVEQGVLATAEWRIVRLVNSSDPLSDAVDLGITWLDKNKNRLGADHQVRRVAIQTFDGVVSHRISVSKGHEDADLVAPNGAVYARPYVRTYGDPSSRTGVITLALSRGGGAPGPAGSDGAPPSYEISDDGYMIRWSQPDGSVGPWLDIGSAAAEARAEADRSREEADRSEAARDIAAGYADDAAALANSDIYATTAGMNAITVPVGLSAILVKGRNSVDDGEGGLFYRIGAVDPVLRRAFQSAGGVWWAPVNAKIARLLWTGQSNADQPWCNSPTPDAISPFARIWNGGEGWVALAAGKGGVRAEATNHSLFNMTRLMIEEGGYDRVEVVFSAFGGRPIREWSGTPGDRTLSVANRPRMQEIVDKTVAAGGGKYTHVIMIQGEADALTDMFPLSNPSSYIAQREYFRKDLVDRGFADTNTRWIEGELLRREVAGTSWQANTAISRLDQVGRDNVAIVSTEGFIGEDEGLTFNLQGKMVPYTLHFSPSENSEYGRRMARAALDIDKPKARRVSLLDQSLLTPWGVPGAIQPYIKLTAGTHSLSSVWTRDGYVDVEGVCNVTLLDDDLRLGARINAGRRITFRLANGATLNLTTQTIRIYQDINGGRGGFSNTLTRKQVTVGGTIELFFDGSNWYMLRDLTLAGAAGGLIWEYHAGYLRGHGNTSIAALTALSQVAVAFPAAMPVITNTTYVVAADNGCRVASKSLTGFVLERAVDVPAAAAASLVNFSFGGMQI